MPAIVLATLNARYAHASLGLRCLRANLGDLREQSVIREFVIGQKTEEIVERLLSDAPRIVGLGVYIWNVDESTRVVAMLKRAAPEVTVVLGGPEVSYEVEAQRICALADYVVTGWGDVTFAKLARRILDGPRPLMKVHAGEQPPLETLALPYEEFDADDLAHRHIYVEASRGCPFKCEFCLSALDKTAWPFPLPAFLAALDRLWARGARRFKFVDRTFNLKIETSAAILDYFLTKLETDAADPPFLHFELIPDHLPDKLRALIARFPSGTLQFEIGIQTFNPEVQKLISRRQDNAAAAANLRWLRESSNAHLHVDLIAGLPGEDLASFAAGFDRLVALAPHEIQFGILKRLRGTPIIRHTESFALRFNPDAPYNILATDCIDFATMQRLSRFARYWDLVANSARFPTALHLLLAGAPFANFLAFSDWLFATTGQTHAIAVERLYDLLFRYLTEARAVPVAAARNALAADYVASGSRGKLAFVDVEPLLAARRTRERAGAELPRQARHRQVESQT
jgi:radical SAM superfamily enzyme YgiQ (UPF0313 family)